MGASLLSIILGGLIYWQATRFKNDGEFSTCRSVAIFNSHGYSTSVIFNFRINGDKGLIFYEGPVFKQDTTVGYINRQVEFTISRAPTIIKEQVSVHYEGNKVTKYYKDNIAQDIAEKLLPRFFIMNDRSIYFDIIKTQSGIILNRDNIPMFYCRQGRK